MGLSPPVPAVPASAPSSGTPRTPNPEAAAGSPTPAEPPARNPAAKAGPPATALAARNHLAVLHDRAVGALVGSALGDAVGLYTEFLRKETAADTYPEPAFRLLPDPTPFHRDFHRLKHTPGEWTDDTDHALLLVLSFLHTGGTIDPLDVARRLKTWVAMGLRALDTPPLGLGQTTAAIVRPDTYLDDPVGAAHAHWVRGGRQAAPNGSLMRTHPLGAMCVGRSLPETFRLAARVSAITHADPRCIVACMAGTALVRGLIRGRVQREEDIDWVVDAAIAQYTDDIAPLFRAEGPFTDEDPGIDVDEVLKHTRISSLGELELDGAGIGYVLKCLGSGIFLLRRAMALVNGGSGPATHGTPPPRSPLVARTTLFEPLLTELVREGGDADTNACFAGALLGAYVGYTSLPAGWRAGLRHGDWLLDKAEALAIVLGLRDGAYAGAADTDTHHDGGRGLLTPAQVQDMFTALQVRMDAEAREFMRAEEQAAKPQSRSEALRRRLRWS